MKEGRRSTLGMLGPRFGGSAAGAGWGPGKVEGFIKGRSIKSFPGARRVSSGEPVASFIGKLPK